MQDTKSILSEYDNLCKIEEDTVLEKWLNSKISECDSTDYLQKAALLNELGAFYRCRNRLEESRDAFENARNLFEMPEMDISAADGLCCCAACSMEKELEERTAVLTASLDYATTLNNLAGTYRLLKKYDTALALFEKCMQIYENSSNVPLNVYYSALNNRSLVYMDQQKYEEAVQQFDEIIRILESDGSFAHETATTYANKAFACWKMKNIDESVRCLNIAFDLYREAGLTETAEYKGFITLKSIVEADNEGN